MQQGVCKLCGNKGRLQNSHTIPKFLCKPLYDKTGTGLHYRTQGEMEIFIQDGPKEPLLCRECEQHIGKIENQFKDEWYCRLPTDLDREGWVLKGFDYTTFKLFHLSILWRCSISNLELHKDVRLGPHEANIAELILNLNAGKENEYVIMGRLLILDKTIVHGIVIGPVRQKLRGLNIYRMAYGGGRVGSLCFESS